MFNKVISLVLVLMLCFAIFTSISTIVQADESSTLSRQIIISLDRQNSKDVRTLYTGEQLKCSVDGNWGYSPKFYICVYCGENRVYYTINNTGTFYYNFNRPGYYKVYVKGENRLGYQKEFINSFKVINKSSPLSLRPSYIKLEKYVGGTVGLKSYGTGGTAPYQYAFYVSKGAGIIYKGVYSRNNTFNYKFTSPGSYTLTAFIKDAKGNRVVKKLSPFYVYPQTNTTKPQYKALVIAQHNYYNHVLYGTEVDAKQMTDFLKTRGPFGTIPVSTYMNQSTNSIISAIRSSFVSTGTTSVSIFYYSGHGASDDSLCGTNGTFLSPATLANELKKLNGKVIVILDSCYSGNYINKGASFNQSVINTFAAVDTKAKVGEMLTNKFHVITGSSKDNYSYSYSTMGGVLTYGIRFANDLNKDSFISMHEAYASGCYFANYLTSGKQTVQCYPLNDNLVLVK